MRWSALVLTASLAVGVGFGWGCGGGGRVGFGDDAGSDEGGTLDDACVGSQCFNNGGDANATKSIDINPKNVTLAISGGSIPTQAFTATLDGQDVTSQVAWGFDTPLVGDFLSGATFTPSGKAAGVGTVSATLNNAKGTTTVTVTIDKVVNTGNLTQGQITALGSPNGGADPMQFLYPSQDTFFPLAVLAPEMMWNGSATNDVYRLKLTEKFVTYTEYFTAPLPSRHIMPQADWKMLEDSGAGPTSDPLKMELVRMSGATVYQPTTRTYHVVQGKLHGSVYYWELPATCGNGNGRILRIKPDSTMVDQFFTNNGQCWGCHTVSRDGSTLMAVNDPPFPFPQFTLDLTKNPVVIGNIQPGSTLTGTFSAFNDKGDKILVSNDSSSLPVAQKILRIADAKTGNVLNANAMGNAAVEPAWSPDGKKIAGIGNVTGGGWAFDCTGGDLMIADVSGSTVSNQKTVVPQGNLAGRPAYPSFSPTSDWIAYGRPTAGSRSTGAGTLWLTDIAGKTPKQLNVASSDNKSFNPVFAPLRAGGYSWVVFITRRDYGNRLVGQNLQQLWITAIDDPPNAADPSHPPFYLRGQEDCAKSENAYYALDPCKQKGQGCESGVDCCSGQCIKDPNTKMYVCGDPPQNGCSGDGNACKVDTDCCDYPVSTCVDGFCQKPAPQ